MAKRGPDPGGWLFHVATRRLADLRLAERARRRREAAAAASAEPWAAPPDAGELDAELEDDTLVLLFTCCHPALTPPSAIALTLRAVGGLTTAEIAAAFLVPETTMGQRISRAKQTIAASGGAFEPPGPAERAPRLASVLHVLYLMFNEGYASSSGARLVRVELTAEAIRIARALHRHVPDEPEVAGLLALMLLTDARQPARTGPLGELIPLDEQDRGLWDRALIAEGTALVTGALAKGAVGAYQLQAAIAALQDEAKSVATTDWEQILALYGLLQRIADNPMVTLSRAVALAMVRGPGAGLAELDALEADGRLAGSHRLDAVRGHLCELAGDRQRALACYRAAAERTESGAEREYLLLRAARVGMLG